MKKYGIGLAFVLSLLLLGMTGMALADAQGVVISETVTIRNEPSTGADAIAISNNGELLTILGEQQNWYHIRFDDLQTGAHGEGYVLKRFLVPDPEHITALGNVYVYAMPTSGAKMVGELEAGTRLVVLGEWDDFWAVNLRTASGFVRKDDVDYSGIQSQPTARPTTRPTPTPETPVAYTWYMLVRDSNLRVSPTASSPSNGVMVSGSYVLIGRIQNGFGQVAENGYWLSMGDLQRPIPGVETPIETSTPGPFRYLVITAGANVYAEPDSASTVVDTLGEGEAVYVSSTQNGFGLVTYGGQRGWMLLSDLLSFHR